MPKNKGKGGKARRKAKPAGEEKRELVYKDEGQEYAQVVRLLGDGRLEANCFDGKKRQCTIRGKMRRRVWITAGDIILVSLRDFQDDKADVIDKYTADEARKLKQFNQIPESVQIHEPEQEAKEEDVAVFGDDEDDEMDTEML